MAALWVRETNVEYYLYMYTHRESGKSYIGVTNDLKRRFRKHAMGRSGARAFNAAMNKYGNDAFGFRKLAILNDVDEAARAEQAAIKSFGTLSPDGYNLIAGSPGSQYAGPHSEETRARQSAGIRESPKAKKQLDGLHASGKGQYKKGKPGKPMSEEAKKKISVARKGKPLTVEHCIKLSIAHKGQISQNKGKSPSQETRKKISNTLKGRPLTPEHRAKVSEGLKNSELARLHFANLNANPDAKKRLDEFHTSCKGVPLSSDHRHKISVAMKGKPKSAEARTNMRKAQAKRNQK